MGFWCSAPPWPWLTPRPTAATMATAAMVGTVASAGTVATATVFTARGLLMLSLRPPLTLMPMPGGTDTTVDTTATGPTAMPVTDTGTSASGLLMPSLLLMLRPGGTAATATATATDGPTATTATRTMVEQFHPFYVSVL